MNSSYVTKRSLRRKAAVTAFATVTFAAGAAFLSMETHADNRVPPESAAAETSDQPSDAPPAEPQAEGSSSLHPASAAEFDQFEPQKVPELLTVAHEAVLDSAPAGAVLPALPAPPLETLPSVAFTAVPNEVLAAVAVTVPSLPLADPGSSCPSAPGGLSLPAEGVDRNVLDPEEGPALCNALGTLAAAEVDDVIGGDEEDRPDSHVLPSPSGAVDTAVPLP